MSYLLALAFGHMLALFRPGTIVRVNAGAVLVLSPENMDAVHG